MTVKTRRTRPDGKRMLGRLHRTPEHARLAERLREVAGRKLSADEILEQTVSWIYGNMPDDSSVTREQVRQSLLERRGMA